MTKKTTMTLVREMRERKTKRRPAGSTARFAAEQAREATPRPGGSAPAAIDSRSLLPPLGPYPGR